MLTLQSN